MKKIKFSLITILALIFLNACTGVKEGLAGNKQKTSDEFLVDKKKPLVFPPKYGELPEPGVKNNEYETSTKGNNSSIKELISQSSSTDTNNNNNTSSSSIEESIIEKINE